MIDRSAFVQRIKSELQKKDVTAKKMLADLGFAPNSFSHWRSGNIPSVEKVSKVADYFGVTIDYLIGKTNVRKDNEHG